MKNFMLLALLPFLVSSEYPKFKRRGFVGPPAPPRPPPQFAKKWPQQPQFFQKPHNMQRRPLMVQKKPYNFQSVEPHSNPKIQQGFQKIPPNFKLPVNVKMPIPIAHSIPPQRQVVPAAPAQIPWQMQNQIQQSKLQFPKETLRHPIKFKPEKAPFKISPTLPVAVDYDYHIQTNSIPTNSAPIQQYGEKGPIHTIPAPNLSLADKPSDLRLNKPIIVAQQQFANGESSSYQYQVTESSENMPKTYFRDQLPQNSDVAQTYQNIQDYYNQESQKHLQQTVTFEDDSQSQQSEQQENTYDSQQGHLYTQAIQSSFIQQRPQLSTIQFVQDEAIYGQRSATEDLDVAASEQHDQIHTEQKTTPNAGFVTATYTLGDADDTSEIKVGSKNNIDPLIQSQIVNGYFDTRTESHEENNVEPDAKPSVSTKTHEELISSFYSSLPSQETAERLAKLQKAGKINSSLMKISTQTGKNPISIYVPDDNSRNEEETMIMEESKEVNREYEDDYSQEDTSSEEEQNNFGSKIKPRIQ